MRHLHAQIRVIAHKDQRYDTVGDWVLAHTPGPPEVDTLVVTVSDLGVPRMNLLVSHHEYTEGSLCYYVGIDQRRVDDFDRNYEQARSAAITLGYPTFSFRGEEKLDVNYAEPGDHPAAPYYQEHQVATAFERLMAVTLGVDWSEYERAIAGLEWRP